MPNASARAAVVAEAIAWLGTPYHHRARLKGVGVDCAQLPIGVYANVGLIEAFDTGEYPPDWHLHRAGERYIAVISRLAGEIDPAEVQPGDVLLFKFGRAFSHGAIVTDWPRIVHANRKDGAVVLGDVTHDADLIGRPMKAFSYFR
jgi:NlpC/P60 family putative phage cell wall peptidase